MKNIIFVNASLTQGGSERVMSLIANGCVTSGLDVTMLLIRDKERTYSIDHRIKCIQFRYKHKNKVLMLMERIWTIRKITKEMNADTVVSFMTDINIFTIISCLGLNVKKIISERSHPLLGPDGKSKKPLIIRALMKILYPKVDTIVFQTEFAKNCFSPKIQKLGVIIPNPISSDLTPVYKDKRSKVMVAFGRMREQKNFKLLIEAFAEIHKEYPDYELVIYGQGEQLIELQNLAQQLNIVDKIEFPGFINNINECIRDAALYVSSSNFEGISNSMLEALAMGLPAICTDCPVGGAALVINNNYNGILIPVGDKKALVKAMKKIISDEDFANTLSRNAFQVRETYSLEKICNIWMNIC